jgi:hypothetical protein
MYPSHTYTEEHINVDLEPGREMESKMGIQIMALNLLSQISVTREITL